MTDTNTQKCNSSRKKLKQDFPCTHCGTKFTDKKDRHAHIKNIHKDEFISMLENQLKESEDLVHKLVEDIEKVKTENKELKTIKKIQKTTAKSSQGDIYDKEDESELESEKELLKGKQRGFRREGPQVQSVQIFSCDVCGVQLKDKTQLDIHSKCHENIIKKCMKCPETFKNENDFDFHATYEHREMSQWNCMNCAFQANSRDNLKNHINFKHTKDSDKVVLNCDKCQMKFRSVWHLRNHKRDDHGKEEECLFNKDNRCKFGNSCWKVHKENTGIQTFTCYSCKEVFKNMNELMSHRKKMHIELCKPCHPKEGACRFANHPERCWFIHQSFQQAQNQQVPP